MIQAIAKVNRNGVVILEIKPPVKTYTGKLVEEVLLTDNPAVVYSRDGENFLDGVPKVRVSPETIDAIKAGDQAKANEVALTIIDYIEGII